LLRAHFLDFARNVFTVVTLTVTVLYSVIVYYRCGDATITGRLKGTNQSINQSELFKVA